jgi:D-alanine--poly(phosphoribitol) ligase subunit 1
LSLATGGTLYSISRDDVASPKQLYGTLGDSRVSVWVSTPSFAQMCLAERSFAAGMLPDLRLFLFCGETLPPEVAAELLSRFPGAGLWNTYGPTEATVATTSVRIDREVLARYSPLPVGYAKPGTRVLVVDGEGREAAPGERGEIIIAGPNVSVGYIGRQDLTDRAFFRLDGARAYRTGDWGRYREGMLFFEGRMDSQIKLHGYRVELGDVEANLRALAGVRDAVVLPVMVEGRCESLAAFVVLAEQPKGSEFAVTQSLRAQLGGRLPGYMVPRKFHFLEAFPMTANGKADRRRLGDLLT